MRHESEELALDISDDRVIRARQAGGIFGDRIQHRLDLRPRAGNDSQDLPGGPLTLQGFPDLPVAGLDRFEETGVLEGDSDTAGECLQETHIRIGIGILAFPILKGERADDFVVDHDWHTEPGLWIWFSADIDCAKFFGALVIILVDHQRLTDPEYM